MIILFDFNNDMIKAWRKVFNNEKEFLIKQCKFQDLDGYNYLVSPANSFGYMDGGIDGHYSDKYDGIGVVVQKRIAEIGIKNISNQNYLPVGSVITVDIPDTKRKLIVAPTMYYPSNIQNTNNVYHVFRAILEIYGRNQNIVMAVPGLGTGVGRIDEETCATDMAKAYKDFVGRVALKPEIPHNLILNDQKDLVYNGTICYQNNTDMNVLIRNGQL